MGFILALAVIIVDQGAKYLVQLKLSEGQSIPLVSKFFYLTYIKNPGAAFGMLPYQIPIFVAISLLVIGVIIYYYRKVPREWWLLRVALAIQAGGAAGNMIDRVRFGKVVDFLDFRVWSYIFNFADAAISIGAVILVYYMVLGNRQKQVSPSEGGQSEG